MSWLKIILKLLPFLAGVAWVLQQWEKKQRKVFSWWRLLALFIGIGSLIGVILAAQVWHFMGSKFSTTSRNCAVVFGAAVWQGNQPSWALDDRVQAGITLYKNKQVPCLVFSGGASRFGAHEVEVMRDLAINAGVKPQNIKLDHYGNSTLATLLNLPDETGFVFVSNDFHLARIYAMARKLGFSDFELHAAPYQQGRYLKNTYYFAREVLGTGLVWLGLW